ncbi:hypothetical protein RDI58_022360 [Solanum bulbocastanum]|uniref:Uncharacterized protein n=1 Tax=Solanum bulbocastanum TaxID=147425 RepID=A0AAN8Y613_SOLBU
MECPHEAPFR